MDFLQHARHSRAKQYSDGFPNALSLLFEATATEDKEHFLNLLEKNPGALEDSTTAVASDENSTTAVASDESQLHTASKLGHIVIVRETVPRKPEFAKEFNQDGYGCLHLASSMGHREVVQYLIKCNIGKDPCLFKDKFGMTPLHSAAVNGRLEVMRASLLDALPESVMVETDRREAALHIAVVYNQMSEAEELINAKDSGGNTVLHLATSRKQSQTLETLLVGNPTNKASVEVNIVNARGFTALDSFDVQLPSGKQMDMEIDKILRRAGALQARHLSTPNLGLPNGRDEVLIDIKNIFNKQPSHDPFIKSSKNLKQLPIDDAYNIMLLAAVVVATMTFYTALCRLDTLQQNIIIPTGLFIFFNSAGFFTSIAMIIYLTDDQPMKLWLLISLSSLLGSYTCLITKISPNVPLNLLFLASPALLLAAARVFAIFCSSSCKYLPWKCTRNLDIY
ncbi:ankyrin repeat-containing protein BDA1-like [Camellia sinensis]|uniref:ankyrin repeat-containing protein BDA1-like n=1 Tax=Camellia sinensis TaxID=4442 RepID=UPI0010355E0E|nr:ankyrin repeat-containing protein BDA1-like [Camellia sinensis]